MNALESESPVQGVSLEQAGLDRLHALMPHDLTRQLMAQFAIVDSQDALHGLRCYTRGAILARRAGERGLLHPHLAQVIEDRMIVFPGHDIGKPATEDTFGKAEKVMLSPQSTSNLDQRTPQEKAQHAGHVLWSMFIWMAFTDKDQLFFENSFFDRIPVDTVSHHESTASVSSLRDPNKLLYPREVFRTTKDDQVALTMNVLMAGIDIYDAIIHPRSYVRGSPMTKKEIQTELSLHLTPERMATTECIGPDSKTIQTTVIDLIMRDFDRDKTIPVDTSVNFLSSLRWGREPFMRASDNDVILLTELIAAVRSVRSMMDRVQDMEGKLVAKYNI